MENEKIYIPIEKVEVRESKSSSKPKYVIKGKAKLKAGKAYTYFYESEKDGTPVRSLKEMFSEEGWERVRDKLLSKRIFVDDFHKTVAELNINKFVNNLERETGRNFSEFKEKVKQWTKMSDMPLFKLQEAQLNDDGGVDMEILMNPHFRELDQDHKQYYDVVLDSIQDGFINSISLNMNPTTFDYTYRNGERIPVIHDADIYGVSLVSAPAHEDMRDVLDIAVRSAQERVKETGKMTDEDKGKIAEQVKKDLEQDKIKEELEALKKEKEEVDKQLAENQEAERQRMIEEQKAEKERLQAELEATKQKLSEQSQRKGLVAGHDPTVAATSDRQFREEFKEKLEGKSMGELIHLQGEFKDHTLGSLPPETQRMAQSEAADIRLTKQNR